MPEFYPYLLIFSSWVFFGVSFHVFGKRLFHPASLMSLLWAVLFSAERILQATILPDLPAVSLDTYLLVFFVLACFFTGGLLSRFMFNAVDVNSNSISVSSKQSIKDAAPWALIFFIAILLLGLPLYVKSIFSIQEQSANENFWVAVRSEIIYGEMDIGPTKYLVAFSVVTMGISYYLYGINSNFQTKIMLVLSGAIALVYNLLYTGRTSIFLVLAVLLGVRSFFIQKNPFKVLLYIALIFILLFSVMGILYEKGGSTSDTPGLNAQSTAVFAGLYLVGPLHGLNHHVQKNEPSDYSGEHTLNFFLRTGENIGLLPKQKPREIVEAYVFIPYPTNVYTAFRVYLRDFGAIYLGFMFLLFGCLHGFLFEKALATRELRFVLYYAFLLFPLLLSFFRDQYMTVFSSWLKIILYVELFLFLIHLRPLMTRRFHKQHLNND